jgi:hypothetical protein
MSLEISPLATNIWATFTSSLPVEDPRNPHPKGYLVAHLIRDGLRRAGLSPEDVENWRDVGYSIDCVIDHARVYLFLSFCGRTLQQWALCCTSDLGWLSRLFGKRDDEQKLTLARSVDAVLKGSKEFADIRWYTQWRGDEEEPWADRPG